MCYMTNLTLRVEEKTLAKARQLAAERSTSVNALIREYLKDLVTLDSRKNAARSELIALCKSSRAQIGKATWTRESLYDR